MSSALAYVGTRSGVLAALGELIHDAEDSIVLQMYLFSINGHQTLLRPRDGAFPYAEVVADWLVERKRQRPNLDAVILLDSNTPDLQDNTRLGIRQRLLDAGICVLNANLFDNRFEARRRWLQPMNFHLDHPGTALDAWVARQNRWQVLHNVEDHRKNLVIDGGRRGLLTSHNLFDAAFDWHENAFIVEGDAATGLWEVARQAVTRALQLPQRVNATQLTALHTLCSRQSATETRPMPRTFTLGAVLQRFQDAVGPAAKNEPREVTLVDDATCRIVQNTEILPCLSELIAGAGEGDTLLLASAYFSALDVLEQLHAAVERGARVRVLIDSLEGLLLPPALAWLTQNLCNERVRVRAAEWMHASAARTTDSTLPFELRVHSSKAGPVMHLKTFARLGRRPALLGGQCNLTPNSFNGAWLETDVYSESEPLIAQFAAHFQQLWDDPNSTRLDADAMLRARTARALRRLLLRGFEGLGLAP